MKKIWDDSDSKYLGLLKQMVYYGCYNAACGLLDDMMWELRKFVTPEEHERMYGVGPAREFDPRLSAREQRDFAGARRKLRQDAIIAIGAGDDAHLGELLVLSYRNRDAFLEYVGNM